MTTSQNPNMEAFQDRIQFIAAMMTISEAIAIQPPRISRRFGILQEGLQLGSRCPCAIRYESSCRGLPETCYCRTGKGLGI